MASLTGKAALITGASRGIGLEIARAFIAEGATAVITGTREPVLRAAAADLGSGAIPIVADVRRYADVEASVTLAVERAGRLDVVVNNAGVGVFGAVADTSVDDWQRVIETNLTGVFHYCKAAVPHLRRQGGGWIINISSLASKNPFPDGAAYCASKAALNAFSESLMQEVRHDNIRVAYVLPGSVRTGFMGRGQDAGDEWKLAPEDVAQVVVDLVAHPARSLPSRVEIRPARPPRKG